VESSLIALGREAVLLVLLISAPPLLAALLIGLVAGVFQAATQVQEQTLSVVPRLAAAFAALGLAAPWIGARVARFAATCIDLATRSMP
jgi:flagellar biosynthesis protein FliQ